jgi:hypothetical protein
MNKRTVSVSSKKAKKATVGTRLVVTHLYECPPSHQYHDAYTEDISVAIKRAAEGLESAERAREAKLARAIDAAIRRAVRDHTKALDQLARVRRLVDVGAEPIEVEHQIRDRFEAKYGVRP